MTRLDQNSTHTPKHGNRKHRGRMSRRLRRYLRVLCTPVWAGLVLSGCLDGLTQQNTNKTQFAKTVLPDVENADSPLAELMTEDVVWSMIRGDNESPDAIIYPIKILREIASLEDITVNMAVDDINLLKLVQTDRATGEMRISVRSSEVHQVVPLRFDFFRGEERHTMTMNVRALKPLADLITDEALWELLKGSNTDSQLVTEPMNYPSRHNWIPNVNVSVLVGNDAIAERLTVVDETVKVDVPATSQYMDVPLQITLTRGPEALSGVLTVRAFRSLQELAADEEIWSWLGNSNLNANTVTAALNNPSIHPIDDTVTLKVSHSQPETEEAYIRIDDNGIGFTMPDDRHRFPVNLVVELSRNDDSLVRDFPIVHLIPLETLAEDDYIWQMIQGNNTVADAYATKPLTVPGAHPRDPDTNVTIALQNPADAGLAQIGANEVAFSLPVDDDYFSIPFQFTLTRGPEETFTRDYRLTAAHDLEALLQEPLAWALLRNQNVARETVVYALNNVTQHPVDQFVAVTVAVQGGNDLDADGNDDVTFTTNTIDIAVPEGRTDIPFWLDVTFNRDRNSDGIPEETRTVTTKLLALEPLSRLATTNVLWGEVGGNNSATDEVRTPIALRPIHSLNPSVRMTWTVVDNDLRFPLPEQLKSVDAALFQHSMLVPAGLDNLPFVLAVTLERDLDASTVETGSSSISLVALPFVDQTQLRDNLNTHAGSFVTARNRLIIRTNEFAASAPAMNELRGPQGIPYDSSIPPLAGPPGAYGEIETKSASSRAYSGEGAINCESYKALTAILPNSIKCRRLIIKD